MIGRGTFISNIISDGSGESNLYLTFAFSWNFPDVQEGTSEATEMVQKLRKVADTAVIMSIDETRQLVQRGEIKA